MPHLPWAVYRVRRLYRAPAHAVRSVQQVVSGDLHQIIVALEEISAIVGVPLTTGTAIPGAPARGSDRDTHPRLWLRTRDGTYPALEEFLTRAPARVLDKTGPGFEDAWAGHADPALIQRERRTDTAIRFVRHVLTGLTG